MAGILRREWGRRIELGIPQSGWRELEKARAIYERLTSEYRSTRLLLQTLGVERQAALESDREGHAKALREGKSEPDAGGVGKVDTKIETAKRKLDALELAIDESEDELIALVEAKNPRWLNANAQEQETKRKAYAEAIEQLAQAREELAVSRATERWLRDFPRRERKPRVVLWPLPGLRNELNQEPLAWESLLACFRADAAPRSNGDRQAPAAQPLAARPTW